MKWKSTLVLLALAGLSAAWLWKGDEWAAKLKLRPATTAAAPSQTLAALEADFAADAITRIEIPAAKGEPLVIEKANGAWRLPGNWPLRAPETDELVAAISGLRTRFQPIAIPSESNLAEYGLASPTVVKVMANGKSFALSFGEPAAKPDDAAFTRPAFVRVNDFPEVLRLGPDVMPLLRRPPEAYRKRQLVPEAERVELVGASAPPTPFAPPQNTGPAVVALLADKVKEVTITGPASTVDVLGFAVPLADGTFTLKRTGATPRKKDTAVTNEQVAAAWEVSSPVRDRPEPAALRRVLAGVPEVWVEEFTDPAKTRAAMDTGAALPAFLEPPFASAARAASLIPDKPFLELAQLDKPKKSISITRADGTSITLQIGGVAKVDEREESVQMPGPPGSPPQLRTMKVPDEFRYAKLADNPQVFVVRAAPLDDLFAKLDDIRDPRVARFETVDVQEVAVAAKGQPPVKLAFRTDRWDVTLGAETAPAESAKVTDLVRQLSTLEASGPDLAANHAIAPDATRITITLKGRPPVVLHVGAADAVTKKLPVQLDGWPRVSLVADTVAAAINRSGTEYLTRDLLPLGSPTAIASVKIVGAKPDQSIALAKDDKGVWKAEGSAFAVDTLTVGQIAQAVSPLQVKSIAAYGDVKWADYGLEPAEFTITVSTRGDKPETHTIKLGKADPAGGRYARIDDGKAVAVLEPQPSLALAKARPDFIDRTLLTFDPTTLAGVVRKKGMEELELAPGATVGWDVVKPAKQKADPVLMDQLAESLGRLRAERVVAHGPKDAVFKAHGLDTPAATLTLTVGEKAETKVLRIGSPVDPKSPDGDRHAAIESTGAEVTVGVISADLAGKLLAAPNAFRDRTLAKFVDADKITLDRDGRKITFSKVEGVWKATDPVMAEAESQELDEFVNRLAKLQAAELVADKPKPDELAKFGLDKPAAKWTVANQGADVLVLLLGKTTDKGTFAKTEKGDVVGLLTPDLAGRALAEYRRRKAWDGVDALQIESIEVARGKASFTLAKRGPLWIDPAKPADLIDPRAVNELAGTLAGLKAQRFAADKDADLTLFGLDEPELVITVTSPMGMRKVLHLGGAAGKGRYAKVGDAARTDVFVLSEVDAARLTRERAVYVEKKPEPKKDEKKDKK